MERNRIMLYPLNNRIFLTLSHHYITIKKFMCYVLLMTIIGYSPFVVFDLYVKSVEVKFFHAHMDSALYQSDFQCLIPDYDPYDPRLAKYLGKSKPIQCGETQPYLTYLDADGYIHLNKTTLRKLGHKASDYDCSYVDVTRKSKNDFEYSLGYPEVFRETERVNSHGFILVRCYTRSKKLTYETGHFFVPPPSGRMIQLSQRSKDGDPSRPNILIFGLDSMSRLNFIRQLPRTYKYLNKILGAIIFKGMGKVGSNTYPNMIPFLAGRSIHNIDGKNNTLFGEGSTYFDNVPMIWQNFSAAGYITMYAEDAPFVNQRGDKGFIDQPTDYYLRPFWLAMLGIRHFKSENENCFGNIPKHLYHIDYLERFVTRMKDLRYFAFCLLSNLSHDDLNMVQVGDSDFQGMLIRLRRKGLLRNTILMFMGDHGKLYHEYRKYDIGRVEERMPFLAVVLPVSFKKKYSHLAAGLKSNENNLLSWFDFHEMLMDIAKNNLGKKSLVPRYGTVGRSPFRPLPSNRSCADAGIPDDYCICARETKLPANGTRVVKAAQDLVNYINTFLLGRTIDEGMCYSLNLSHVISAHLVSLGPQAAIPEGFRVLYRIALQTSPGGGQFEGTLELDAWAESGRVVGDINRLNIYGIQSHCVSDKLLRFYCYCTDLPNT